MSSAFLPFTRPHIDEDTIADVAAVLRSGWLTTGPRCQALEAALSERFGGRAVKLLVSGTAALELSLRVADIGPGDEVITTPLSWVATANTVLAVGATPVFVDIDPRTRNIDLDRVEAACTPRTRAVIPVDLAGLPVDRDRLAALAAARGLRVIEDAAQSFGARWRGREVGAIGDLVCFSFHANKNFTTAEGGCVVFERPEDARRMERMRLQGVERFPDGGMDVREWGAKANLTDVAAAIGLGHLKQVDAFTRRRAELAERYFARFPDLGFELPPRNDERAQGNWHMFQPLLPERLAPKRGAFIAGMKEEGIGVGVHYPAMHLFTLFRERGHRAGDFPFAESVGARTLTLPLFPQMQDGDVDRVCEAVATVCARLG